MAEKRQNEISFTDRQTDTQTAPTLPIVGSKIFFEPTKRRIRIWRNISQPFLLNLKIFPIYFNVYMLENYLKPFNISINELDEGKAIKFI